MRYNLWFGVYDGRKVELSDNFEESFLKAENPSPLPFNVSEVGVEALGKNYYQILRKTALKVAEKQVEKELRREDRYVVALVKALDELDEAINMLSEKLEDIRAVKDSEVADSFEEKIRQLKDLRKQVEREIEEVMEKIAPNMTELVGAKIAAKLLERAGSMDRLVKLPASKIQVIGAEKSLYKAFARMKRVRRRRFQSTE